jgi:hypothetical protein
LVVYARFCENAPSSLPEDRAERRQVTVMFSLNGAISAVVYFG